MKKVLSKYKSVNTLSKKKDELNISYAAKKSEVEEKQKELSELGSNLFQNRRKMMLIIKNKLLSVIPKYDKQSLNLLQKKFSHEDFHGDTILEILLYDTYPLLSKKRTTGNHYYKGKSYSSYFYQWWLYTHSEREIDLHGLSQVLERLYKKSWKNYIKMEKIFVLGNTSRQNLLFVDIQIL